MSLKCGTTLCVAMCLLIVCASAHAMDRIPDQYKTSGFALGCQAWSFNHFSVFEAIEKTAEAGGKVIEFYPGQRLSAQQPDVHWDHNASDEVIQQVQEQCRKYHILPVNYGVVTPGGRTAEARKEEWRKIFEFAKKLNLYGVTSEPAAEDMDTIEQLVKEFDIHFCIHDHPKRANDPNYRFWDPHYVLSLVQGRDPRIGACADTGHWIRSGIKPVDALRILKGRVMSSHLKDLNEFSPEAHDVPYGQGVADVKAILDELKAQNFQGNISVEYEYHMENSLPEIKECIADVKQYGNEK